MKSARLLTLFAPLWLALSLGAHPLNWTKLTLAGRDGADPALVARLEIDLARYVGDYTTYHQLTTSPEGDGPLREAVIRAMHEITVTQGSRPLAWQLEEFIPPSPDDDFFSALPTPMAFARFSTPRPERMDGLQVTVAGLARLELPLVVRVQGDQPGDPQLLGAGSVSLALALSTPDSDATRPLVAAAAPPAALWPRVIRPYLYQGFVHILPRGLDHILFVLGLFFAGTPLRRLLLQISAFTLAHTLTLAAATLGWIAAPGRVVEPLIAASILWLAVENLLGREPPRSRHLLVFGFGLMHGLGFASALQALGLPPDSQPAALLAFNVGVELGQLAVLAGAFALVGWWRSAPRFRPLVVQPVNLAMALVAGWWGVERLAG